LRSRIWHTAVALIIAAPALAATATVANADTAGTGRCASSEGAAQVGLPAKPADASSTSVENGKTYKAQHDTEAVTLQAVSDANASHDAQKMRLIKAGAARIGTARERTATCPDVAARSASSNAVLFYFTQYPQVTNSFCGPATISEFSASVPGSSPYNLNQWTVAAYMDGNGGNSINANGTSVSQEVDGLNHFVGLPDFGWNYYGFVWMDYFPTSAQRSAFEARVDANVSQGSPVAGDAWEVAGGPHLVGHPANQTIFHWFAIGGRSGSSTYYADSATSVWSGVPSYSWYDTYTLETILGGRGYIW
jgi:hypothetical protein